ncbi:MAG TPA: hypothetical protein VKF36_21855 [Syntrophorhabdales bacterium]|nr:hypothetical protein [Syntrophorhabdales bacterium]
MNAPKKLIVEYEDGTRQEAAFGRLSSAGQAELSALGLCEAGAADAGKKYLLLEWKDGWKEIAAVGGRAVEILRYYTIERTEEIGRLSMETADGNPELLFIKRLPGRLESILFIDGDGLQAYALEEKAMVKEGGKTEHYFYDKKRSEFKMKEPTAASARYTALVDSLKSTLEKKGITVSGLLAMSKRDRIPIYKEIARTLGLRGAEREQDVYDFLTVALEKPRNK